MSHIVKNLTILGETLLMGTEGYPMSLRLQSLRNVLEKIQIAQNLLLKLEKI